MLVLSESMAPSKFVEDAEYGSRGTEGFKSTGRSAGLGKVLVGCPRDEVYGP